MAHLGAIDLVCSEARTLPQGFFSSSKETQSRLVAARQSGGCQEEKRRYSEAAASKGTEVLWNTPSRNPYEAHISGRVGPDTKVLYD